MPTGDCNHCMRMRMREIYGTKNVKVRHTATEVVIMVRESESEVGWRRVAEYPVLTASCVCPKVSVCYQGES